MRRALLCPLLVAGAASFARAQDTTRLAPGDGVLVTTRAKDWKNRPATFIGFRGDSVVVWGAMSPISEDVIAFRDVRMLLVNHGNRPARSWALEGMAAGAVAGLTWGSTGWLMYPCENDVWLCDPVHYVGSFVIFGAALGGIVGAVHHAPPYKRVKLRPRVAPATVGDGRIAVAIGVAFSP